MIRLMLDLQKMEAGESLTCIITRQQKDSLEDPFTGSGYIVRFRETDQGQVCITIAKRESGKV